MHSAQDTAMPFGFSVFPCALALTSARRSFMRFSGISTKKRNHNFFLTAAPNAWN